jgi:4-aminobutyrate aminotransferase/(S)-3-amino-2-methylpropionate transaminase
MMDPLFIPPTGPRWTGARGSWVYGKERMPMLDFRSGVMTTNMGHGPLRLIPPIVKAIVQGMGQAWYSPNKIRDRAHAELAKILPWGFDRTVFVVTGSEAVEVACRAALAVRGGKVAHFGGNYHGSTTWVQQNLNGWMGNPVDFNGTRPYPRGIGVMVMTPYLAAYCSWMTGARVEKFIKWIKREEIILIDDEIQAGFGRCGSWWGFQNYTGLIPDIIVAGKAATGLLPLSFVSFQIDIAKDVPPEDYISTHSGNPVCLAAMIANIRWMRKADAPKLACMIGLQIVDWAAGMRNLGLISNYEGQGAAYSIYLESEEQAKRVVKRCANSVLLFDTGKALVKIVPPLNISSGDLACGLDIIRRVIEGD